MSKQNIQPSANYFADTIIVGAGLAGLTTALELLDAGKKILIIDRDSEENLGGLAKWAFGGMFFVDTAHQRKAGIKDNVDLALRDWFSYAEFDKSEVWGKKWAEYYVQNCTQYTYEWLKKQGIQFFPVLNWTERGLFQPGNSVPRFHMVWGTGWELTYTIIRQIKSHPKFATIQFLFDHRVSELVVENQMVTGVRGFTENTKTPFEAKAETTVVASGGINGSIEKIKQNWYKPWGTPPEIILNGAHPYAVGDLHDATNAIQGNVVNLDKQWNYAAGIRHYAPRYPDHGLSLIPCKSALWLNFEGRRLGPVPLVSTYDTRYFLERINQEPVKYTWQLMNYKIALKELAISGSEHNPLFRDKKFLAFVLQTLFTGNKKLINLLTEKCEDVVTANTLDELASKMNNIAAHPVKPDLIQSAVRQYDENIDRGPAFHNDEQLRRIAHARQYRGDRARTCKFQKINDSGAMPFIAIRTYILSRKSLGGIQTDLQCRVLNIPDASGVQHPIPGLYAVGEAAGFGGGGIHGYRSLEGTFLGGCVFTGRVAAKAIASH